MPRCKYECIIPYKLRFNCKRYIYPDCHRRCLRRYDKKFNLNLACKVCNGYDVDICEINKCKDKTQCNYCLRWRIKMLKVENSNMCFGCVFRNGNDYINTEILLFNTPLNADLSNIISGYTGLKKKLIPYNILCNYFLICRNMKPSGINHKITDLYCKNCKRVRDERKKFKLFQKDVLNFFKLKYF